MHTETYLFIISQFSDFPYKTLRLLEREPHQSVKNSTKSLELKQRLPGLDVGGE